MDSRKCQTPTASPAEPGELPIGLAERPTPNNSASPNAEGFSGCVCEFLCMVCAPQCLPDDFGVGFPLGFHQRVAVHVHRGRDLGVPHQLLLYPIGAPVSSSQERYVWRKVCHPIPSYFPAASRRSSWSGRRLPLGVGLSCSHQTSTPALHYGEVENKVRFPLPHTPDCDEITNQLAALH